MATKLRKISTNTATKIIAFLLSVIFITTTVVSLKVASYRNIKIETLFQKEYRESSAFTNRVFNAFYFALRKIQNKDETLQSPDYYYYYYISDGTNIYTNTQQQDKSFFEKNEEAYYAFENGRWTYGSNTKYINLPNYFNDARYKIYIAFTSEYLNEKQREWEKDRAECIPVAYKILILLASAVLTVAFLMIVTDRRSEDKMLHSLKIDNIYSDILVLFLGLAGLFWLITINENYNESIGYQKYSLIITGTATAFVSILCGLVLLSLTRKAKAGKLIKHSFIYTLFYNIYDLFKSLYDGRMFKNYPLTKSLFYRQLIFIVSSGILVFFTFLFLLVPPLFLLPPLIEIVIVYWYVKGNNKIYKEINKGFNQSLEEQMKSERMKISLVTNVSHDLKTPLTSIISYVDLLSKEEDLSETSRDYVNILKQKSDRLKQIVSDLFDLAKSTSGDITIYYEQLDLKKLIEQTLGDMEDKIEASGLQLKIKLPSEPVNIIADGKKLYRVFQNVIDNVLKYSLIGTRAFIELEKINGIATATIKNTACYEMDFTEEEILQRFTRGDKSRTTEGSGLGLSIAESFTNVCGGRFKIAVDGDLFKVIISFDALSS